MAFLGLHQRVEGSLYVYLEAREARPRTGGLHLLSRWKGAELLIAGPALLDTETYDFELPIFHPTSWKDKVPLLNLLQGRHEWHVHAELRTNDWRTDMSAEAPLDVVMA